MYGEAADGVEDADDVLLLGDTFVLLFFDDDLRANHRDDYAFVALSRQGGVPGVGAFAVANDDPNPPAFRGQYADLEEADEPDATGPVLSATDGVLTRGWMMCARHCDAVSFARGHSDAPLIL